MGASRHGGSTECVVDPEQNLEGAWGGRSRQLFNSGESNGKENGKMRWKLGLHWFIRF